MDAFLAFRASLTSQLDRLQEQLTLHCNDIDLLQRESNKLRETANNDTAKDVAPLAANLDKTEIDFPCRTVASEEKAKSMGKSVVKDPGVESDRSAVAGLEIPGVPNDTQPSSNNEQNENASAIERWAILVENIWTIPMQSTQHVVHDQVQLRAMWNLSQDADHHLMAQSGSRRNSRTRSLGDVVEKVRPSLYMGETIRDEDSWAQIFIWHPDSKFSLLHAWICTVFITYDVISFPLIAFNIEGEFFYNFLTWFTTIFWTCDIPTSFLQGYHSQGVVEMRPAMVARHYIKSWCVPDIIICSIDWFLLINQSDAGAVLRAGKASRSPRFLRAARVLRLVRTFETARDFIDSVANETMIVALRVFALLLFILAINHYIACAWYSLAFYNHTGERTWLEVAALRNDFDTQTSKYIMSLSWSLTQFTPATNDITPANARERLFATGIVLFAFVLFSFLVSSLTNAMMEIKNLNLHKHQEERLIREFLANKKVSIEVGNRIWHFYRKHYKIAKKAARESDIAFFKEIPSSLRSALHMQIFMPTLLLHPAFDKHSEYDPHSMRDVCNSLEEKCFVSGFEMFSAGDIASRMSFVTSGSLSYDCSFHIEVEFVNAPLWVSEAALWTKWVHRGHLVVRSSTELLQLESVRFEKVMQQWAHEAGLLRCLRKYATLYAHHVNERTDGKPPVTDISQVQGSEGDALRSLAHRAFASTSLSKRSWQNTFLPDSLADLLENARSNANELKDAFSRRRSTSQMSLGDTAPRPRRMSFTFYK